MSTSQRSASISVRLSAEESKLLAELSAREHLPENALVRKWVLDGLMNARLESAIADYKRGDLNLGESAIRAGVSVERMLTELDSRGIDTISVEHFYASLNTLRETFGTTLRPGQLSGSEQDPS